MNFLNLFKFEVKQKEEKFSCEVCGVLNVVKTQYEAHIAGKKHLKALKREQQLKSINRLGIDSRTLSATRAGKNELLFAQRAYERDLRNQSKLI